MDQRISLIEAYIVAWNLHNKDAVMKFFADDAEVKISPPPPEGQSEYKGIHIEEFVEKFIPGVKIVASNFQVNGDEISWDSKISSDLTRQFGQEPLDSKSKATLKNGRIKSLSVNFSLFSLKMLMGFLNPFGKK